jgi:hypothetical protein
VNNQDRIVVAEVKMQQGIGYAMFNRISESRMVWPVFLRDIVSPLLKLRIELANRCDNLVVNFILGGYGIQLAVNVFFQL